MLCQMVEVSGILINFKFSIVFQEVINVYDCSSESAIKYMWVQIKCWVEELFQ